MQHKQQQTINYLFFQFPASIKLVLKGLALVMATYSEYYFSLENKFLKMLRLPFACLKYLFNPELLSQRLVEIHKHSEIGYGKFLCNFFESKPYVIFQEIAEHRIAVNHALKISPDPIKLYSGKFEKLVDIPVPKSHIGVQPVLCRLLSRQHRIGMVTAKQVW